MRKLFLILFCITTTFVWAQQPKLVLPVGHTSFVISAGFSHDGKRVVTGSVDNSAKIWDAATGVLLADLKGHSERVRTVQFSSDDKRIVTAGDNSPKIWDAATGV